LLVNRRPEGENDVVKLWQVRGVNVAEGSPLVGGELVIVGRRLVGEFLVLHQMRDCVQAEAISAFFHPKSQNVLKNNFNFCNLQVEIFLTFISARTSGMR
jgi:hypothetical protein